MWSVGAISFVAPWALAGLAVLPVIWWLLRLRPPQPRRIVFPPIVLLQRLVSRRESPVRIPPWLLALRLVLAGLIIAAAAGPLLNADTQLFGKGPLYVVVDDDWSASDNWPARKTALQNLIDHAERQNRPVVLVPTAPAPEGLGAPPQLMAAKEARRSFEALQPKAWPTDRQGAVGALLADETVRAREHGDVVWLSNGINEPSNPEQDLGTPDALITQLSALGKVTVYTESVGKLPVMLNPPEPDGASLKVSARRTSARGGMGIQVRALAEDGEVLGRVPLVFKPDALNASGTLELPSELRNRLYRLEIADRSSAGAVILVDERWRRRPVGLVSASGSTIDQPLLDALHYLDQAVDPFAEVRKGAIGELLKRGLAVLILADPGRLDPAEEKAVSLWIDKGGVLVRFAGPRLARDAGAGDQLLPVQIRRGGRVIGGALSWRKPESLAPFGANSPFHGIPVPKDVTVRRQVLAQPTVDLAEKTWARLTDGTPLVTGVKRGAGWLVLLHTTANAEWSDLAFSGLFVNMLRRLIRMSQGISGDSGTGPLSPIASLDAFGRLGDPPGGATAIAANTFDAAQVSPAHPPGFYGAGSARRALNLPAGVEPPVMIETWPNGVDQRVYAGAAARDLQPWLLTAAAILFLIDLIVSMKIRGLLGAPALRTAAVVLAVTGVSAPASANDAAALANTVKTRIAYVITGNRQVDETSRAGLIGLNTILWRRTAAELAPPQGIDPAVDELAFFPLIYWPIVANYQLAQGAAPKVVKYLRNGGTILFDTRDHAPDTGVDVLGRLSRELEIPPLVPVGESHVLTRAFYLLKEFPGRWTGGALWVEKAGERINDGVSPVIAGGHDWAAAWAIDDQQRPLYPVVPGGERQREMAYRFGVNLVMYTLTGNYKADQVHLPAIMRRLSQ